MAWYYQNKEEQVDHYLQILGIRLDSKLDSKLYNQYRSQVHKMIELNYTINSIAKAFGFS